MLGALQGLLLLGEDLLLSLEGGFQPRLFLAQLLGLLPRLLFGLAQFLPQAPLLHLLLDDLGHLVAGVLEGLARVAGRLQPALNVVGRLLLARALRLALPFHPLELRLLLLQTTA